MDKFVAAAFSLVLAALSLAVHAETTGLPLQVANVDWSYDFFLCKSDHDGSAQTYSCRDYTQNDVSYRLFYRGGTVPRAVARIDGRLPNESIRHFDTNKLTLPVYQVQPPAGLPRSATFLGTGVCRDDSGNKLPCGVFEHFPGREAHKIHYMVLYHDFGGGPIQITRLVAGPNPNAIPAEFAYQTGLGLVKRDCCREEGMAYLELAYKLFPDFEPYRQAYQRYHQQEAVMNLAKISN